MLAARIGCGAVIGALVLGCGDDDDTGFRPPNTTTPVGTFDGLFNDVVTGFNFPFDIGIVSEEPLEPGTIAAGDILVANYGTSEVLLADPVAGSSASAFYDGTPDGLRGATAVSIPPDGHVWAAFEQGGDANSGGIAILSSTGERIAVLDGAMLPGAFANPGGICYGGNPAAGVFYFYLVNLGDGTAWRIRATNTAGDGAEAKQIGSGLATGTPGNPGTAPTGVKSQDLPQGGARGCVHYRGRLYVADAQNARVARFDDAEQSALINPVPLEDTPPDLVTYPTDVTVNSEGVLIVISYDNAHAFVALATPNGSFIDNGLYNLNVNSGNYGTQVARDTIWFTRANNTNGALRAITPSPADPPTTTGPFPAQ